MCVLLLMSLWARLKWEGGHAIGINEMGNMSLAMDNCLRASAIYSLVGFVATILIARQNPPSWWKCTRQTNQRGALMIDQDPMHRNFFSPPWPIPEQSIKYETRKWEGREHPKQRLIVCVEGNIGSGKSTLINSLKEKGWKVYQEPVEDRWKIPLQDFYRDPLQHGLSFQITVLEWFKWLSDNTLWIPRPTQNRNGKSVRGGDRIPRKTIVPTTRYNHHRTFTMGLISHFL